MKKIFSITFILILFSLIFNGCDIVEEPYLQPTTGGGHEPGDNVRKVLLEDYTGQKCPNCPGAAEEANKLKTIYGEQLVLLTIHAGFYAEPDATGDFTADFRTPEGNELNTFFGFPGYPMGTVNRAKYSGSTILLKDSWEDAVAIQVALDAQASIEITTDYTPSNRNLICMLETEFLDNLDGTYNICAFILESGIISPQQTPQDVDENYEHNHVLRTSMNGTWGELVGVDGMAVAGVTLTNHYTYTLPDEWNADNCEVIAFVYDNESLEIIQAEEKKVQ
jgi:hypothetical protein